MEAKAMCYSCLIAQQDRRMKDNEDEAKRAAFMNDVCKIMAENGPKYTSPYLSTLLDEKYEQYFGPLKDYDAIKNKYNTYMLSKEKVIEENIRKSDDLVATCVKYICAGNYIDFGAMEHVDDSILDTLLNKAKDGDIPLDELNNLKKDLENAKSVVYLTDNCGEIVCDKIFMKILNEVYPNIKITTIVRGFPTINDATIEDAKTVGLDTVSTVIGSGARIPGTVMNQISEEAKNVILNADVIISKGQGNFEGIFGNHLHIYYFFLCKCQLFTKRFGLPQFSSVFCRDDHIKVLF